MKRILLLYTGGTIGSEGDPLAPMAAARFAQTLIARGLMPAHVALRALPRPLDSASMQPADWLEIAAALLDAWDDFDGFVVLHGTDTLAYTASALSFLLAGCDKPVVITGSQHPLDAAQTDAISNLTDAIAVAGEVDLYEVVVCFAGNVLRGNRSIKRSAVALDAFASPGWPALGVVENGVVRLDRAVALPAPERAFSSTAARQVLDDLRESLGDGPVWVIHLHPGFPAALLHAALALPRAPRGWVLACYGSGNAPEDAGFLAALQAAHEQGVLVLAITQTGHGSVNLHAYAAGTGLARSGVISGGDLSLPAAVSKLQLLLARGLSHDQLVAQISTPIAGEMS